MDGNRRTHDDRAYSSLIALGLAGLYTRLTREEVLEHPTRRAIRDLVEAHSGLHESAIAGQVDANDRTAEYHLQRLVDEGVLTTLERGGYTHHFVAGEHTPREMQAPTSLQRGQAERVYEAAATRAPAWARSPSTPASPARTPRAWSTISSTSASSTRCASAARWPVRR